MGKLDPKMQEEVSWHAVNSVRVRRTLEFFKDEAVRLKLIMLLLVLEPLQWLTSALLIASREIIDPSKPTLVCDAVFLDTSPFVVCLQYLTCLLRGECTRVSLLYRTAGCSTYQEFCRLRRAEFQTFRMCILCATSWVYRRHHYALRGFPWRLFALADPRVPAEEKAAVRHEFLSKRWCCHKPGWARRLRLHVTSEQDLEDPAFLSMLHHASLLLKLSIAGVERRHAWNRAHSSPSHCFSTFASMYVSRESHFLQRARRAQAQAAQRPIPPALGPPAAQAALPQAQQPQPQQSLKGEGPLQVYRKEWLAERRAAGEHVAWNAGMWPAIKRDFAALDAARRQEIQLKSEQSINVARLNRKRMQQQQQQQQQQRRRRRRQRRRRRWHQQQQDQSRAAAGDSPGEVPCG